MPIRIPLKSDIDVQDAFRDVENELSEIDILKAEIEKLKIAIRDSDDRLLTLETPHTPTYNILPDTVIQGNLNVAGNLGVTGAVNAPGQIGGYVKAVTPGTAGTSLAQPVIEVHGALKVLSGLRADTLYARNIVASSDIAIAGHDVSRTLTAQVDTKNSSGTGETDAHSYTLPANLLAKDGDRLVVRVGGTVTSNSNLKTVRFYFDGTSYTLFSSGAASATAWSGEVWVVRKSSSSAWIVNRPAILQGTMANNFVPTLDASVNFSGEIAIKTTVQMATSGTTAEHYFTIEYVSA